LIGFKISEKRIKETLSRISKKRRGEKIEGKNYCGGNWCLNFGKLSKTQDQKTTNGNNKRG
jgi:hypothetical protein